FMAEMMPAASPPAPPVQNEGGGGGGGGAVVGAGAGAGAGPGDPPPEELLGAGAGAAVVVVGASVVVVASVVEVVDEGVVAAGWAVSREARRAGGAPATATEQVGRGSGHDDRGPEKAGDRDRSDSALVHRSPSVLGKSGHRPLYRRP